jgi:hypothetical protein
LYTVADFLIASIQKQYALRFTLVLGDSLLVLDHPDSDALGDLAIQWDPLRHQISVLKGKWERLLTWKNAFASNMWSLPQR